MENVTPWGIFWAGFFGCLTATLPSILGQILTHRRQMAEFRHNNELTEESRDAAVGTAKVVVEAADKMDSATRHQASTAQNAAIVAKEAAKVATAEKQDAKEAAKTTVNAVEKLSGDVNQLKEFVNGYLTQRLQEASKSGYAMGVSDAVIAKVGDHETRLGSVETKLGDVDSKVETILEIVKGANGDRTQVRGESIK